MVSLRRRRKAPGSQLPDEVVGRKLPGSSPEPKRGGRGISVALTTPGNRCVRAAVVPATSLTHALLHLFCRAQGPIACARAAVQAAELAPGDEALRGAWRQRWSCWSRSVAGRAAAPAAVARVLGSAAASQRRRVNEPPCFRHSFASHDFDFARRFTLFSSLCLLRSWFVDPRAES